MKIITFNTWGKNGPHLTRFELILKELLRVQPDIACLQEVFDSDLSEEIRKKTDLKNIHAFFEIGLTVLSRFPFDETITNRYQTKSPLENYPRGFILAKQTISEKQFWVGNTHLSWQAEDNKTRADQISELLTVTETLNAPVILTGDFNTSVETEPILKLKKAGFIDLCNAIHPNRTSFTWDNKRNPYLKQHSVIFPDRRIDLLMASRSFVTHYVQMSYELCFNQPDSAGNFPSDHFGVVANFK